MMDIVLIGAATVFFALCFAYTPRPRPALDGGCDDV